VVVPCRRASLTTTVTVDSRTTEETVMMNWTEEAVRVESEYRRQALRRMAAQRHSGDRHRTGGWHRWLPRGLRH
jgi:hypothetical protein